MGDMPESVQGDRPRFFGGPVVAGTSSPPEGATKLAQRQQVPPDMGLHTGFVVAGYRELSRSGRPESDPAGRAGLGRV